VIDYRKDDPAAAAERFDVVLDTVGKLPYAGRSAS
jgi:NADPH:quinone reductase-like Zn-dependent oxidoreductase